jgi:hypothetical protein
MTRKLATLLSVVVLSVAGLTLVACGDSESDVDARVEGFLDADPIEVPDASVPDAEPSADAELPDAGE